MRQFHALVGFVVLVGVVGLAAPVRADDVQAARQHYLNGSKAFDLGNYALAIKEYMAAYDAKPDPALLYNIAQTHKLAGHPSDAVRFYRIFLMRYPDAPDVDEVRRKIGELQQVIDRQRPAEPRPEPPSGTRPEPKHTVAQVKVSPMPTTQEPSVERGRSHAEKVGGLAVAGVGVGVLAAGVALSVVAKQDSDQLTLIDQQRATFDPSKDATGRALGVAGPVLIAIGSAAVVGGGIVAILGVRGSRRARTLADVLAPSSSPRL